MSLISLLLRVTLLIKRSREEKKNLSEVIVVFLTVLNVNLKNRPLLLKHSYLKQSGQQHWWMIKAVWVTQGDFMPLSEEGNTEFFSIILTQLWNAVSYSKCKTAYQNPREYNSFFPSTCIGKNHRLFGNFSKFLYSVSLFASFYYTKCFL